MTPAGPRPGFSLIEVLVALGVVAVLLTLVLPALARAREAGRSAACQANLRAFGTAFAAYQRENRDMLPLAFRPADLRLGELAPFSTLARHLDGPLPSVEGDRVVTAAPYRCPSGAARADLTGFSYDYRLIDWMGAAMGESVESIQRQVRVYLDSKPGHPIMADHGPVHDPRAAPQPFGVQGANLLRADWSVARGG